MRFLVVGTGSIGTRHCRNLSALGHGVLAWDTDPARLREVEALPGVKSALSLEHGLGMHPDGVLICTPPASHVSLARRALEAGAHVFVEKPLAPSTDGVEALLDDAERRGHLLLLGFNLRFLPSLRCVKALLDERRVGKVLAARAEFGYYLPAWRPTRDYRQNYAVRADLGGGILLDASHEFDYLDWFFGDVAELFCTAEHRSDLAGDTEDLAEVTLRFRSGVLAQVHLDYLQRAYRRNLEIIGSDGVIVWDYPTQTVTVRGPEPDRREEHAGSFDAGPDEMYVEGMRHFVRCIEGQEAPMVDGLGALRSLRIVEAAKTSARERRWVTL